VRNSDGRTVEKRWSAPPRGDAPDARQHRITARLLAANGRDRRFQQLAFQPVRRVTMPAT
jgi:hypothetical protein